MNEINDFERNKAELKYYIYLFSFKDFIPKF